MAEADEDAALPSRVAILGLGLMGGSLGLALKRQAPGVEVRGYARREAVRREALEKGVVGSVFADPASAVDGADLSVFCLPVLDIAAAVQACGERFKAGSVVTDVGSTKRMLDAELTPPLAARSVAFVGSHPICGSEATGLAAARADLYDRATVIVTPSAAPAEAVQRVLGFWAALGARTAVMTPQEHDRIMARTSHLPHLVAAALAGTVLREPGVEAFCGAGFRDTTRIAAGSDDLWHDIVKSNCAEVARELEAFAEALAEVRALVAAQDFEGLRSYLAAAAARRRSFNEGVG